MAGRLSPRACQSPPRKQPSMPPAKSEAQMRLMRAVAHSPSFAAKVKIPQSVGRDFSEAGMAHDKKKASMKRITDALKHD